MNEPQLRQRINTLADDIGRLRRRLQSLELLADQIAGHIEALHTLTTPTAAELAKTTAPGDEEAVKEAIRNADATWASLQTRLGKTTA